jgi:hypothetical protein
MHVKSINATVVAKIVPVVVSDQEFLLVNLLTGGILIF